MKRLVLALAIAWNLWSPGLALAEDEDNPYSRSGFYMGLGFAVAIDTFDDDVPFHVNFHNFPDGKGSGILNADYRVGMGLDAVFGYRIHPWVAVEFETEWVGPQEFAVEGEPTFSGFPPTPQFLLDVVPIYEVGLEPLVGTVNAKIFAMHGIFQPYALIGAGVYSVKQRVVFSSPNPSDPFGDELRTEFRSRQTDFAMRFGIGFDYYSHEKITVGTQVSYVLPFGSVESLGYVSIRVLNVAWRF